MSEERPPRLLPQEGSPSTTEWRRVLALFLMVLALSVAQASVLVGIPLVALVLVVPTGRLSGLVAGALAAVLAFGGAPREALWYAERGWAILLGGWFAALTLRWPGARFFPRALGAVAGALAVTAVVLISLDGIEQRRGAVQADADEKLLRREEAAPLLVHQRSIGLNGIDDLATRDPVPALDFQDSPEIIDAKQGRFAAVPHEHDHGRRARLPKSARSSAPSPSRRRFWRPVRKPHAKQSRASFVRHPL